MSRLRIILGLAALMVLPCAIASDSGLVVRGPSWIEDCRCLIYYSTFDLDPVPVKPEVNSGMLAVAAGAPARTEPAGLFARALNTTEKPLVLSGEALSPHRPLTISFWWALPKDLPADGSFSLFQITGRGIIAAFTRGKGEWCALKEPAGVLQVYYFPGIQDVNGIYDVDLAKRVDLRAGAWHHTAAVIRQGAIVELYTDGMRVAEIATSGRAFLPADGIRSLRIGGGVVLDEVLVLDRALDAENVADYYRGLRRLAGYRSPEGKR